LMGLGLTTPSSASNFSRWETERSLACCTADCVHPDVVCVDRPRTAVPVVERYSIIEEKTRVIFGERNRKT
jgi:hypothetical protein